ncbi:MAG: NAD(P)H-hydrate dehydratase [Candidatus Omnitrophota bacterium]
MLRREDNSHKGDFGHIFIVAGSLGMCGAAILAARAALRCGAGLVTLGIARSLHDVCARQVVEVMLKVLPEEKPGFLGPGAYSEVMEFLRQKADVLLIGPGLSRDKGAQQLVRNVVANCPQPMVIDADGLNALVGHLHLLNNRQYPQRIKILTPHLGEMSRLVRLPVEYIEKNRLRVAKKMVQRYNNILVMKGHRSAVVDSNQVYINNTGNPGMATAGCGDVLAGMIAAFFGQGLEAFSAAKAAVYVHGRAGDLAAKQKGQASLIASDVIDNLPPLIRQMQA